MATKKKKISIGNRATYFYTKNIKKWRCCPACKSGILNFDKKASLWICRDCRCKFPEKCFLDDNAFWFCDKCEAYLNNQEGFKKTGGKHICKSCGYENDIKFANTKGICSECGKIISDSAVTLCGSCRRKRNEKTKQWVLDAGKITIKIVVVGAIALVASTIGDEEDTEYTPLPDDNSYDDNEVYGLGAGKYPTCKTCGKKMTKFDGWAWYTCPNCGDMVRIIDGKETWRDEIFTKGKKQHRSDFERADFCRGGDLTED